MVTSRVVVLVFLACCGCAASTPRVEQAPMPDDISPWQTPIVEPSHVPMVPNHRPASPAEKVAPYVPGTVYQATVTPSAPLVIQLHEGEVDPDVIWPPVPLLVPERSGPDEALQTAQPSTGVVPWDIQKSPAHPHVYVTVKQPGLTLGVTITTKTRTYLLDLKSVAKSPVRLMRWTYDAEVASASKTPRLLPDHVTPQQYHTGYTIEPSAPVPVWCPYQTLDDGAKTYILFPRNLAVMSTPMIRLLGVSGPELVNARFVDHVLVIDHLAERGVELRLGHGEQAEVVRIVRGPPQKISCPGAAACPVWPEVVARR